MHATKFQAIGTHWYIAISDTLSDKKWDALLMKLHARIQVFDKAYSRFRPDSLVSEMSRRAGTYSLPQDGHKMLSFYERLYNLTEGKVTPLIGQTMVEAGYDAHYSFEKKQIHRPPAWNDVMIFDELQIAVRQPALLDFGAAGKGYLVDILGELIEAEDIGSYLINAGGDIRHRSEQGEVLEVGLENPLDTTEAIGIAAVSNQSLCASSGSKRKWGDLHHIIDPDQLASPAEVIATWVLAADTMTADGLATALFFVDYQQLRQQFDFSYAILHKDMELVSSADFPSEVFTA